MTTPWPYPNMNNRPLYPKFVQSPCPFYHFFGPFVDKNQDVDQQRPSLHVRSVRLQPFQKVVPSIRRHSDITSHIGPVRRIQGLSNFPVGLIIHRTFALKGLLRPFSRKLVPT